MRPSFQSYLASPGYPAFQTYLGGIIATLAFGGVLAMLTASPAAAQAGAAHATPQQRRACTPDVYRLCAGEIPNVARITACLRRKRDNLSEACRAVFEQ